MRMGPRRASSCSGPLAFSRAAAAPRLARRAAAVLGAAVCAAALGAPVANAAVRSASAEAPPATCIVHSLPAFTAQGEFEQAATVADVVEVECNPFVYGTGSRIKVTAEQLYSRCKGHLRWYVPGASEIEQEPGDFLKVVDQRGISLELDADGNATVALLAGPECAAGESLISAHMEEEPFETFTTSFTVLPPENTPPGVFALPAAEVEDAHTSSVATILQAEFAGASEKLVRFGAGELFSRCRVRPHIRWIRMDGSSLYGSPEITGVQLDNNGNAFVIALGEASCAEGTSLIEADLESKPFTTFTTSFTVLPPQPTAEPAFSIEKRQQIAGSGFTTERLGGAIGQTVEYEIIVRNTASVPETLANFTDAHCDAGTISGGPGSAALAPSEATTYTCSHVLSEAGTYTNDATVTAETAGGTPLTKTSNEVVVEVPGERAFTIEKLQQIVGSGGGFTREKLEGAIGETVDYLIEVTNTGTMPLVFSGFVDSHCDEGTITGGPGASPVLPGATTIFACSHLLTSAGPYVNVASATAAGEPPLTHGSNAVEVDVPGKLSPGPPPTGGSLPFCAAKAGPLRGVSGSRRGSFTARISAQFIKQVTFFLDGRKLKTFTEGHDRGGKFSVRINAKRLAAGTHRVRLAVVMNESACGAVERSGVFVRPARIKVEPSHFAG
jgi:hypothetical protein